MRSSILILLATGFAGALPAGSRSSPDYSVLSDNLNGGGLISASPNYANHGSIDGGTAAGTSAAGLLAAKAGYIGQLTEATGLFVTAATTDVPELGTLPLGASQILDDATTTALLPASVSWSISSGPLSSVSPGGLVTAAAVYQNTPATVQATAGGFIGSLNLMVLDTQPDNFGSYAGDGIDDAWQFQYFGLNNPQAAPGVDASGSGQTNLFKFVAGLNPLDPNSRFVVQASAVSGQATQREVRFSPVVNGRTYTVRATENLAEGGWMTLPGGVQMNGSEGVFLDTNATGPKRFYEVQISRP